MRIFLEDRKKLCRFGEKSLNIFHDKFILEEMQNKYAMLINELCGIGERNL